jgi:uncharacterized protein GlcG (DUF336 family)
LEHDVKGAAEMSTRTVSTLNAEAAERLIDAVTSKSDEMGRPMAIAVCDPGGNLIAFRRMDGAPLMSSGIAQDKAYTAASFGMPTDQWHDFIKDDPPLALGIVHTPRLVTFGGGYPVQVDGQVVAGLGLSGGHYSEDMECAQAALAEVGLAG